MWSKIMEHGRLLADRRWARLLRMAELTISTKRDGLINLPLLERQLFISIGVFVQRNAQVEPLLSAIISKRGKVMA